MAGSHCAAVLVRPRHGQKLSFYKTSRLNHLHNVKNASNQSFI